LAAARRKTVRLLEGINARYSSAAGQRVRQEEVMGTQTEKSESEEISQFGVVKGVKVGIGLEYISTPEIEDQFAKTAR